MAHLKVFKQRLLQQFQDESDAKLRAATSVASETPGHENARAANKLSSPASSSQPQLGPSTSGKAVSTGPLLEPSGDRPHVSSKKVRSKVPVAGVASARLPTSPRAAQRPSTHTGTKAKSGQGAGPKAGGQAKTGTGSGGEASALLPATTGPSPTRPVQPSKARRGMADRLEVASAGSTLSLAPARSGGAIPAAEGAGTPIRAPASTSAPSLLGPAAGSGAGAGNPTPPVPVDIQDGPMASPRTLEPLTLADLESTEQYWAALHAANPGAGLPDAPRLVFLDAEGDWMVLDDAVPWTLVAATARRLLVLLDAPGP